MEKRKNRSDAYQHVLVEFACGHDVLEGFCNEDSIYSKLNPFDYDERLLDLKDQLKEEFWRIVNTLLTPRQKEVLELRSKGLTQMEIAKKLKVNQSSITKCIYGNTDYRSDKRIYGGIKKRLDKIIENDDKIKAILKQMRDIQDERW